MEKGISKEQRCEKHRFGKWELLVLSNALMETCSCEDCGKSRVRRITTDEAILKGIFVPKEDYYPNDCKDCVGESCISCPNTR